MTLNKLLNVSVFFFISSPEKNGSNNNIYLMGGGVGRMEGIKQGKSLRKVRVQRGESVDIPIVPMGYVLGMGQ